MNRNKIESQATIVTADKGVDIFNYVNTNFIFQSDQVIHITDHKKTGGSNSGIYIEDIRQIQENVRASRKSCRTIIIISNAALLTPQAQSALLKSLEEPNDGIYFLLLTHAPNILSKTILSRCQITHLSNNPIDSNKNDLDQINKKVIFMAKGSSDELNKLLSDSKYAETKSETYELASSFIKSSRYESILIITNISKKSRENVLLFLDAAIHVIGTVLKNNPSPIVIDKASALMEAYDSIKHNGSVRVHLMKSVV